MKEARVLPSSILYVINLSKFSNFITNAASKILAFNQTGLKYNLEAPKELPTPSRWN